MSCHTDGSFANTILRFGGLSGSNHCDCRQPADTDRAKVLIYEVYPPLEYDNANIDQKPRNAATTNPYSETSHATQLQRHGEYAVDGALWGYAPSR